MQAVMSASNNDDEFIRDFLVSHDKVKLLIKNLIKIEVWKDKVFREIINKKMNLKIMFPVYIVVNIDKYLLPIHKLLQVYLVVVS